MSKFSCFSFAGSLKLGVVSGRLAFKKVRLVTEDYFVIIYDEYLWFRYWLPYQEEWYAVYAGISPEGSPQGPRTPDAPFQRRMTYERPTSYCGSPFT